MIVRELRSAPRTAATDRDLDSVHTRAWFTTLLAAPQ